MSPETLSFLKQIIYKGTVSRICSANQTEYNILSDFGVSATITETTATSADDITGKFYQVTIEQDIIYSEFCSDKHSHHTQVANQVKSLIKKCSDKLFYQEKQTHKQEYINQQIKRTK